MRFASCCAPWRRSTSSASSKPLGTRRRRSTKSLFSSGIDLLRRSSTELMIVEASLESEVVSVKTSLCFFSLIGEDRPRDMEHLSPRTRMRLLGLLPLLFFLAQGVHYYC